MTITFDLNNDTVLIYEHICTEEDIDDIRFYMGNNEGTVLYRIDKKTLYDSMLTMDVITSITDDGVESVECKDGDVKDFTGIISYSNSNIYSSTVHIVNMITCGIKGQRRIQTPSSLHTPTDIMDGVFLFVNMSALAKPKTIELLYENGEVVVNNDRIYDSRSIHKLVSMDGGIYVLSSLGNGDIEIFDVSTGHSRILDRKLEYDGKVVTAGYPVIRDIPCMVYNDEFGHSYIFTVISLIKDYTPVPIAIVKGASKGSITQVNREGIYFTKEDTYSECQPFLVYSFRRFKLSNPAKSARK